MDVQPAPKRAVASIIDGILALPTTLPNGQLVTLAIPTATPTNALDPSGSEPYITVIPTGPVGEYTIELYPLTTTIPISILPPGVSTAMNGLLDGNGYVPSYTALGDGSLLGPIAINRTRQAFVRFGMRVGIVLVFGWCVGRCLTEWVGRLGRRRRRSSVEKSSRGRRGGISDDLQRGEDQSPKCLSRRFRCLLPITFRHHLSPLTATTAPPPQPTRIGSLRDRTLGSLLLSQTIGVIQAWVVLVDFVNGYGVDGSVGRCVSVRAATSSLRLVSLTILLSGPLFLRTYIILDRPTWLVVVNALSAVSWVGVAGWGIHAGGSGVGRDLLGLCESGWSTGETVSIGIMATFLAVLAVSLVRFDHQLSSRPKALGRTSLHYSVHAGSIFHRWTLQRDATAMHDDEAWRSVRRPPSGAPSVASATTESFGEMGRRIKSLAITLDDGRAKESDRRGSGALLLCPPGDEGDRSRTASFDSWARSSMLFEGRGPRLLSAQTMDDSPTGFKRESFASSIGENGNPFAEPSPTEATKWRAPSLWDKSETISDRSSHPARARGIGLQEALRDDGVTIATGEQGEPDYAGIGDEIPERKAFRAMVRAQAVISVIMLIGFLAGVLAVALRKSATTSTLDPNDWADIAWALLSVLAVQSFSRHTWSEYRDSFELPALEQQPRREATRPSVRACTTGFSEKDVPPLRDSWPPYPEDASPGASSRRFNEYDLAAPHHMEQRTTITALPKSLLPRRSSEPRAIGVPLYRAEHILGLELGRQPSFISPRRRVSIRWHDESGVSTIPPPREAVKGIQSIISHSTPNPFEESQDPRRLTRSDTSGTQELSREDLADILFSAGIDEGAGWVKKGSSHASSAYTFPDTASGTSAS